MSKKMAELSRKMKRCPRCKRRRQLKSFALLSRKAECPLYDCYCIDCEREYQAAWYRKLPVEKKALRREKQLQRRRKLRRRLYMYLLEHPCIDCGESDPVVLEFDHTKARKQAGVSRMMASDRPWARIMEEISKCVVRCANCHRRITAERAGFWKVQVEKGIY